MSQVKSSRAPYVDLIGESLRDVPWAKRQALLDDVAVHVSDAGLAPGELDSWVERYGPPEEYARQLRGELGLGTDAVSLERARRFRLRSARLRTRLLVAAAVVVIGTGGGTAIYLKTWFDSFQPFDYQANVSMFGSHTTEPRGQEERVWSWRKGRQLAIGVWLANRSDKTVRVTALRNPDVLVPWDNWRITLSTNDHNFLTIRDRPFAPFTLRPGKDRLIWFRGDFTNCPKYFGTDSYATVDQVSVGFEVYGRTLHRTLSLPFAYGARIDRSCRT